MADKSLAWLICSKKPYRKLEDYALTLAGIPPLPMSALNKRGEDNELNRLYLKYFEALQHAVALGDLNAARCNGHWVCRYTDFLAWAQKWGYECGSMQATHNINTKSEYPETTEWKAAARKIGEAWMNEQRKIGEDPSVADIAKHVEGEFSNQEMTGKRGKFLDWETIKREALTGITGKPVNGKGQKRRKKPGESPAIKTIPPQQPH